MTDTTRDRSLASEALANLLEDTMLLGDLAPKLTCTEAEIFGDFIRAYHGDELAEQFLEAHATSDEEGDSHFAGGVS